MLREKLHAITAGTYVGREAEELTFDAIAEGLRTDYTLAGNRSLTKTEAGKWKGRAEQALTHLAAHFKGWKVRAITSAAVATYHTDRLAAGAAQATVHYEIAVLKRAFTVARRNGQTTDRLEYKLGAVANARAGFFERAEFEKVRKELPEPLRPVMAFAYLTGWRKREILNLRWRDVDFAGGMVRLEPGTTKNREGRAFPFGALPELAALLKAQRDATSAVERERGAIIEWVFHRNGEPIRSYDVAWRSACERAGVPGRLVHDFRRSAVRNLERAGVSRSVARKITGHKTEAVYNRYAIVAESDLNDAAKKLAALAESHTDNGLAFPKAQTA
ncbi:MAG: site-specific integrase [Gemmatimonadales bacterium]